MSSTDGEQTGFGSGLLAAAQGRMRDTQTLRTLRFVELEVAGARRARRQMFTGRFSA